MTATNTAAQDPAAQKRQDRAKRLISEMLNRTQENGCSEAEAMEAAAKVGEMLRQYDLELTDIIARDTSDMRKVEVYAADTAMGSIVVGISKLCSLQVYGNVRAAVQGYTLFGHAPDTELAVFLYGVCCEAADHGWSQHMAKHGFSKKARDSYRAGFANRVYSRMVELRQRRDAEAAARAASSGCRDLVVLKDEIVQQEFGKLGIKLSKSKSRTTIKDLGAYGAGQQHANTVNLNNPLGSDRAGQGSLA